MKNFSRWIIFLVIPIFLFPLMAATEYAVASPPRAHADKGHGHDKRKEMQMPKKLSLLAAKGRQLVSDLHCNACHFIAPELAHGERHAGGHGAVAPDISFVGNKFRPEWLYKFLRTPRTIRPWLKARMPSFRLTEEETVALVRHLTTDMKRSSLPRLPPFIKVQEGTISKTNVLAGQKLMSEDFFECWKCHQQGDKKPQGPPEDWAPDLLISSQRLKAEWIVGWLRDPQRLMPGTEMPAYFTDSDSGPEGILDGDEEKQIRAIRDFILSLSPKNGKRSEYELVAKRYSNATRAQGWQLMTELNCAGCHEVQGMHEQEEIAPPLAHEGSRVRKEWLVKFLSKPYNIRPAGYFTGKASRMPNMSLSPKEAEAIATYLMTRVDKRVAKHEAALSDREDRVKKGGELFANLRCMACHRTNGQQMGVGAKKFQGPNLAHVGWRLQEGHLRFWLAGNVTSAGSKLEMDAHPLVSKLGLSKEELENLAAFLVSLK